MSRKLTQELKNGIVGDLIRHRFDADTTKLEKERDKLADAIFKSAFSAPQRKKMNDLPAGWLPTTIRVDIMVGGQYSSFQIKDEQRIPYDKRNHRCMLNVDGKDPLGQRVTEWNTAWKSLQSTKDQARKEAHAILNSVTTTAKLQKVWPEIEPFLPDESKPSLPAVEVSKVNGTFKLPVKKAA